MAVDEPMTPTSHPLTQPQKPTLFPSSLAPRTPLSQDASHDRTRTPP
jgi:hypothetical protein